MTEPRHEHIVHVCGVWNNMKQQINSRIIQNPNYFAGLISGRDLVLSDNIFMLKDAEAVFERL